MIPALSMCQELADIVALASTLEERLTDKNLVCDKQDNERNKEDIEARLETWCHVVTGGNWDLFRQRLAWGGLNLDQLRKVLGTVSLHKDTPLPSWASTIEAVIDMTRTWPEPGESLSNRQTRCLLTSDPLPFEEVLLPFIAVAQQRVMEHNATISQLFGHEALAVLERTLLKHLSITAGQALYLEFSIRRAQSLSSLTRFMIEQQESAGRELYDEFIGDMLSTGLLPFFQHYPVLARVLATITDCWVETTVELAQRLACDSLVLEEMFGIDRHHQRVTGIQADLSDPHRGRRSVFVLTFASGQKLVYKPKDLGIEKAYNQFLHWCNEQGLPLAFKVLRVVERAGYGWVEYIERQRCQHEDEVKRYFQRAGMLLCLVYALQGTDCHQENLIAHNEYPVLIDAEALMQHHARLESFSDGAQAQLLAHEVVSDSVLHTGLLPSWQISQDEQQVYDISGLRGPDEYMHEIEANRWLSINSDSMTLQRKKVRVEPAVEESSQSGIPLRLAEHREEVIAGFTQFYQFLLHKKAQLLQIGSPLYLFQRQPLRLIYRNTHVYGALEYKLRAPRYLRNGVDRSIQLEALVIAVLPTPDIPWQDRERSRWWPVFAEEQREMQQMDIPFFNTSSDSDALLLPSGQRIEGCFQEPSFDRAIARFNELSPQDMQRQVSFIAGSLYSLVARDPALPLAYKISSLDLDTPVAERMNEHLLAHALRIGRQMEQNALHAQDGSISWIIPQYMFKSKRYQFQPIASDLYSGSCGIALFLSALAHISADMSFKKLALGAIQSLRNGLRTFGPLIAKDLGLGAASGMASLIYTFVRISQLLDEPSLLDDARHAATLITYEEITNDQSVDIFAGVAGTILGLLTLYAIVPDQELLEKARACGERVLQTRVPGQNGYRAWPERFGKLLTGFSHGAAGIAYALLRLYTVTGENKYRAAAQEGIAYEDSMFLPQINNWPDLRSTIPNDFRVAWCHGAPGIGLARVGGLPVLAHEQIYQDIEIALRRTEEEGLQSLDHLCCGNMGRIEFLLTASQVLARPECLETARRTLWRIIQEVERTGRFALDPLLPPQVNHFGFFQGTAGSGYMLLRMIDPATLPSVLLWQ